MKVFGIYTFLIVTFILSSSMVQAQSPVDYAQIENWAATPFSYPASLKQMVVDSSFRETDVFYVY
ncbi:MAG: hypothetical protein KC517_06430, partial [Bacteroidetes bacterium]|nr:hypothetical protein [Bacteroidota bacterium]